MFQLTCQQSSYLVLSLQVDMFSATSQQVYEALQAVLTSPEYTHNARTMATRIRDQPISVKDKVNTCFVKKLLSEMCIPFIEIEIFYK